MISVCGGIFLTILIVGSIEPIAELLSYKATWGILFVLGWLFFF